MVHDLRSPSPACPWESLRGTCASPSIPARLCCGWKRLRRPTKPRSLISTTPVSTDLGYVWYRKDTETRFGIGVLQPDHEAPGEYEQNFALYNAPPGTWQRMAVYFYLSQGTEESARDGALAFTHHDHFRPVAGYKVMVNHLHTRFTEQIRAQGSLDGFTQELAALKAMGVNIVGLSDFHDD